MCSDSASRRRTRTKKSSQGNFFLSQSQKTEVHAPGFLEFAKQILSKRARSARKARRRRAFFASLRDAAHAKRALSPAVFRQSRNRQDRRTAVRRIKFPIKVQLCRTFIPLPAPWRRGLVRRAAERGVSPPVPEKPEGYLGGTKSPPRGYAAAYPGYTQGGYEGVFSPSSCAAIPRSA